MPKIVTQLSALPNRPAVYAIYGGDTRRWVAYVGVGDKLKQRITQHLVRRDSSVTTGTSAVGLNVEYVREVSWWTDPSFADKTTLLAAEIVAFDVLEPALRSRGGITGQAEDKAKEQPFRAVMEALLLGPPAGRLLLPSVPDLADRVATIEGRLQALEDKAG